MELRLYWAILKRRLWLVAASLLAFSASYLFFGPKTAPYYTASMRFVVGLKPEATTGAYYAYDRYYTWLTAEYLLDDFAEVVKSAVFAQDVAELSGVRVPPGTLQGATSAGKLHRILTISVSWTDAQELARIASAVVDVLSERGDAHFAQLAADAAAVSLIDPPTIARARPSLRQRLDLPVKLFLSLGAGIALAFLLDYLDDTVRDGADLRELGLSVLAEIPRRRRWLRRLGRRRPIP